MNRHIVHIYIPSFPIQMEMRRLPRLRGWPVVVVPNVGQRAIIRAVSVEATCAGIRQGMLLSAAQKMCRDLEVLPYDERYYRSGSEAVFAIACKMSPIAEPINFGKAFADLSFAGRDGHLLLDLCWSTIKDLRHSIGISPALGLASNKLVSMIASHLADDNDLWQVAGGDEKKFLQPLPARQLPAVDQKMWRRLWLMGLRLIGNIACFEVADLALLFGRKGMRLHEQANGIDNAPVMAVPQNTGKVFGEVLVPDTNDVEVIRERLFNLADSAGMELRAQRLQALQLSLAIEYADARQAENSYKFNQPSSADADLKDALVKLLDKTLRRRVSVRVITLRVPKVVPAALQLDLFPHPLAEKRQRIEKAMEKIRGRFGREAIGYARVA